MPSALTVEDNARVLRIAPDCPPVVKAFIEDPTFVCGFFGPLGCGKTTAGAVKAWLYGQAWPGAKIAVIRDTWPNLRDTTQATFFNWFPDGVAGKYYRTERRFSFFTGPDSPPSDILFRAMEEKDYLANVLSLDLAAAWIDEPQGGLSARSATQVLVSEPGIDADLFKAILGRLGRQSGYPGLCWLTGNPPEPTHWIAREFQYAGRGEPTNPRPEYHLYLGERETNRRNIQHRFRPASDGPACGLCGQPVEAVAHQADYYERLESIYGQGTPLARRFLDGEWVPFALLSPFQADWIHYYERRPELHDCFISIGVDPAISKRDESSRSAIVVTAQPTKGLDRTTAFVLEAVAGHWTAYETANRILRLLEKYPQTRRLRMEANAWQVALKEIVEREARLRGLRLPLVDSPVAKEDKMLRASSISGLVETGRVQFGPGLHDLIDCMISVPRDPLKWDPVDALYWSLTGLPHLRAEAAPLDREASDAAKKRAQSYVPMTSTGLPLGGQRGLKHWRSALAGTPLARRRVASYATRLL